MSMRGFSIDNKISDNIIIAVTAQKYLLFLFDMFIIQFEEIKRTDFMHFYGATTPESSSSPPQHPTPGLQLQ